MPSDSTTEPIVGIDLGTTNTRVAVVVDGVPEIIPTRAGETSVPSMVAISEAGNRLVGQLAKRQAVSNPRNTVAGAKRIIGKPWDSEAVRRARDTSTHEMAAGTMGHVRIMIMGSSLSVPEIGAMILQEMRLAAEHRLGCAVDKAVITVPAYFTDGQREATMAAGRIAGLEVARIISEPVAAALAFAQGQGATKTLAVYDLGGGTFDISILRVESGTLEVIAAVGDAYLGGEDFDARIVDLLMDRVPETVEFDDLAAKVALQRLKAAAEKARCDLSFASEVQVDLPFLFTLPGQQIYHMHETLGREQVEELTGDLVDRTIDLCEQTIAESRLTKSEIEEVLLVGGVTRMPLVRRRVAESCGRDPNTSVHPGEAVALGAAIQAAGLGVGAP
jgi:molecular chaperone DnaK